jgi:hypothetical protein
LVTYLLYIIESIFSKEVGGPEKGRCSPEKGCFLLGCSNLRIPIFFVLGCGDLRIPIFSHRRWWWWRGSLAQLLPIAPVDWGWRKWSWLWLWRLLSAGLLLLSLPPLLRPE